MDRIHEKLVGYALGDMKVSTLELFLNARPFQPHLFRAVTEEELQAAYIDVDSATNPRAAALRPFILGLDFSPSMTTAITRDFESSVEADRQRAQHLLKTVFDRDLPAMVADLSAYRVLCIKKQLVSIPQHVPSKQLLADALHTRFDNSPEMLVKTAYRAHKELVERVADKHVTAFDLYYLTHDADLDTLVKDFIDQHFGTDSKMITALEAAAATEPVIDFNVTSIWLKECVPYTRKRIDIVFSQLRGRLDSTRVALLETCTDIQELIETKFKEYVDRIESFRAMWISAFEELWYHKDDGIEVLQKYNSKLDETITSTRPKMEGITGKFLEEVQSAGKVSIKKGLLVRAKLLRHEMDKSVNESRNEMSHTEDMIRNYMPELHSHFSAGFKETLKLLNETQEKFKVMYEELEAHEDEELEEFRKRFDDYKQKVEALSLTTSDEVRAHVKKLVSEAKVLMEAKTEK